MEIINSDSQSIVRFAWTVRDGTYIYMDTWEMTQEEWDALTPELIEQRQQEQYTKWREHMAQPEV